MAARQDQTLVIALIVFVCIAVIGLAWGYLMFKSSSDAHKQLTDTKERLRSEEQASRNLVDENQTYRRYIGLGESDNLSDVTETYDKDMERFGGTFDVSQRSYRNILITIYEENEKIAQREADAKQQVRELKETLLATEAEKEAQVQQWETAMNETKTDAAQQRLRFEEDRKDLEAKKQELLTNLDEQKNRYQGEVNQRQEQIASLTSQLDNSNRANLKLLEERETSAESFEVPDGSVSWVNQDGTVWINLGAADSLRRQVTFSVYDAELEDPAKAVKKGSIEVTRVLGDHMAEARITDDNAIDPILTGDHVYSQVWHPGKQLRFALTGFMDIDGDGDSDLQLARDLIELNGGVVDAYLDEEGNQQGEMSVNTRYLVLGEFPEDALKANIRDGWSDMTKDADNKGVESVLLAEFLDQMGYTPQDRTVPLGRGARAIDFKSTDGTQRQVEDITTRFRRRTPYRTP
jgi:hypothetical protein